MARFVIIALLAFVLSGCSWFAKDPQTTTRVDVPIATQVDVPEELEETYRIQTRPVFVNPDHPEAVAALTEDGIEEFQVMTNSLLNRIRLWESYYIVEEE